MNTHTDADISGKVTSQVVMGDKGTFSWENSQATEIAKTKRTIEGFGDPIALDVDLSQGYGEDVDVQYKCTKDGIELSVYIAGTYGVRVGVSLGSSGCKRGLKGCGRAVCGLLCVKRRECSWPRSRLRKWWYAHRLKRSKTGQHERGQRPA
jgi:hypothetical protein